MNCDQAIALISAEIDREIRPDDRPHLEAHLRECAGCRATADAFRIQDADLRRAFALRRPAAAAIADRVIAQLRTTAAPPSHRWPWLPMVLSAAAGFLIAVLIFRPWERRDGSQTRSDSTHPVNRPTRPGVRLAVATGTVEIRAPGHGAWQVLERGDSIAAGARVRTGPTVRCEFQAPDGSEIRLNGGTELRFATDRQLDLVQGQILARVAKAPSPFQVTVPEATVTALGTQFDILCKPAETLLTVLQGRARVEGQGTEQTVETGEAATIVHGRIATKHPVADLVRTTRWVHEILVLKGRDNPELAERVDDLLAQIGHSKMQYLNDDEIRALGDHCVLPLTRFIQSARSQTIIERPQRIHAARLLADLAQPWSIPDLIKLLHDTDKEVRYYAAKGLERLTGETFGRRPEDWRDQPPGSLHTSYRQWQTWWEQNKGYYPNPP